MTRWDEDANPETAWFSCSIDQLAKLRNRAMDELGYSNATVNGLVGWIVGGDANAGNATTRAAYRKILREVGPPPRIRPRGARKITAQRGAARLTLVGAAAGAGSVLAIASQSGPVAASLAAAAWVPIILGESSETAQRALQDVVREWGVAA